MQLSPFDYTVICFYLGMIVALGLIFRRINLTVSDYFRGSGSMLWWMVGAAAFIQQFSAWTFTAGAGKAYSEGILVMVIFLGNALGYLSNALWTGPRFRQMRFITQIEAVRERFDRINEQFFTWVQVPVGVVYSGIFLNALAIFLAAVFRIEVTTSVLVAGVVIVVMTVTGGSWAVVASNFIQTLILMTVTAVTAWLALRHPAVGGLSGFVEKMPSRYYHWGEFARPGVLGFWIVAILIKQFIGTNSLGAANRYLCAKDGREARRGAFLACGLMILGAIIWFIPPMAAGILQPDLAAHFPLLGKPEEAAYVFIGHLMLPAGMFGFLLCAMFSATMSSVDAGLNRNAGIFIKNFYQPILFPRATERHLVIAGRTVSACFGVAIVLVALFFSDFHTISLFDLMLLFGSYVALPCAVPLFWCLIVRRGPGWAGWSSALAGLLAASIVSSFSANWWWSHLGFAGVLSMNESIDFKTAIGVLGSTGAASAWFLAVSYLFDKTSEERRARVAAFFRRASTPVDFAAEGGIPRDRRQGGVLGVVALLNAVVVLLLAFVVPETYASGRGPFLIVAAAIGAVGWSLLWSARRRTRPDRK